MYLNGLISTLNLLVFESLNVRKKGWKMGEVLKVAPRGGSNRYSSDKTCWASIKTWRIFFPWKANKVLTKKFGYARRLNKFREHGEEISFKMFWNNFLYFLLLFMQSKIKCFSLKKLKTILTRLTTSSKARLDLSDGQTNGH